VRIDFWRSIRHAPSGKPPRCSAIGQWGRVSGLPPAAFHPLGGVSKQRNKSDSCALGTHGCSGVRHLPFEFIVEFNGERNQHLGKQS
jgi:hypothetical protein